jgi:hypothetical protein
MSDFNLSGGIGVMGFIAPMNTEDTYSVIDPIYGIDGLRNVDDILDLNNVTIERRRAGMLVGVNGGESYYKLKNITWDLTINDWEPFTLTSEVNYSDKEVPLGDIDDVNKNFILQNTPTLNSEHIYLNGILQEELYDYTMSANTISFIEPLWLGVRVKCSYRY